MGFKYENGHDLYDNLSFSVSRGERLLIRGDSGSGKSTLIKLILGLYRLRRGKIEINGTDLGAINKRRLRERTGYVFQNIFLFNKSLRDNLLLGKSGISDGELEKLLRECGLEREGMLDLEVSEKGLNFSGGERQRLALVRALIKNPDIIILDEATANLDLEAEREVEALVLRKFSDRIVIKVSHRPESIAGWRIVQL